MVIFMNNSRYIPKNEERKVYMYSGMRCAKCKINLYKESSWIGEIAHIEAVNPGGARFNPELNLDYINSYENLILLCPNCHKEVDANTSYYTVDVLKTMKHTTEMFVENFLESNTFSEKDKKFVSEIREALSEILYTLNNFNLHSLFLNDIGERIDELLSKIELNQYMLSDSLIEILLCIYNDLDEINKLLAVNSFPYEMNPQYNYISQNITHNVQKSIEYLRIKAVKDINTLLIHKIK